MGQGPKGGEEQLGSGQHCVTVVRLAHRFLNFVTEHIKWSLRWDLRLKAPTVGGYRGRDTDNPDALGKICFQFVKTAFASFRAGEFFGHSHVCPGL